MGLLTLRVLYFFLLNLPPTSGLEDNIFCITSSGTLVNRDFSPNLSFSLLKTASFYLKKAFYDHIHNHQYIYHLSKIHLFQGLWCGLFY